MSSQDAFTFTERLIVETNVPYIPQHSGEIWELAYFHERGISATNKQANQNVLFKELMNHF